MEDTFSPMRESTFSYLLSSGSVVDRSDCVVVVEFELIEAIDRYVALFVACYLFIYALFSWILLLVIIIYQRTMATLSNYQAIPDASAAVEEGSSELAPLSKRDSSSKSEINDLLPSALSMMSKLGYIALGLILGYCSSGSSRRSLWNPTVRFNETEAEEVPWFVFRHHHNEDKYNIDKSFTHSLPFEEAFPGMKAWENTLSSAFVEESKLLSASSSPFTSFFMSSTTSASSGNNIINKHLLYLVHATAVSLLYDSSRSSNNIISEYSLDYFLINSGGFDAQINQAYCGVVSIKLFLTCHAAVSKT